MIGLVAGEKVSVHFHASGVILNHNFTTEFFKKDKTDCQPCKTLAADVEQGVSCHILLHITPFEKSRLFDRPSGLDLRACK